jgi:hypothetical protein
MRRFKFLLQCLGITAGICVLIGLLVAWHDLMYGSDADKYKTLDMPRLTEKEKQQRAVEEQVTADRRRQENIERQLQEINRKLPSRRP